MRTIDREKLKYDEICRVEALYQRFPVSERVHVQDMLDSNLKFITEGPILIFDPETNSLKVRYILLFSALLICTKKRKETLNFRWKLDLYTSTFKILEKQSAAGTRTLKLEFRIFQHKY
jgi:hypothetical protein